VILDQQEERFDEGRIQDEEAVEIMRALLDMRIPYKLESSRFPEIDFYNSENKIDLAVLETLGAGSRGEETRQQYLTAISNWFGENLAARGEYETYSAHYRDLGKDDIYTHIKLTLNPTSDIDELYIVLDGDPSGIRVRGDVNTRDVGDSAVGIILEDLSESTTVNCLYQGGISFVDPPVYISPQFKKLVFDPSVCTDDDCKPDRPPSIWWTVLWILLLLFGAFVIYVILQEWYKRYYQSHLFKNKNQLFNLIYYMYNSAKQNKSKDEIFDSLREQGWKGEQIAFAWKKFNGKRTGMWEIPIFKFSEQKKVREEINKRKQNHQGGISGNIS
jgi:hypothetical protein